MKQELAPPWLSFNKCGSKLSLPSNLSFNSIQVWEVVSAFGLSRCLEHEVLFLRHMATDEVVVGPLLVLADSPVGHLQVLPGHLDGGLGRGVRVKLDNDLLVVRVVQWLQRSVLGLLLSSNLLGGGVGSQGGGRYPGVRGVRGLSRGLRGWGLLVFQRELELWLGRGGGLSGGRDGVGTWGTGRGVGFSGGRRGGPGPGSAIC